MSDHGILFKPLMVRAILDGRKTQTRRANHLHRLRRFGHITEFGQSDTPGYVWHFRDKEARWHDLRYAEMLTYLPWKVGDRLWVREPWSSDIAYDDLAPQDMSGDEPVLYLANSAQQTWGHPSIVNIGRFRAAMHMPRWASRLTLTVTEVRIVRLRFIHEEDAIAEGAWRGGKSGRYASNFASLSMGEWFATARGWFEHIWGEINGPEDWEANPYVVAYTFEVHHHNIDVMEASGGMSTDGFQKVYIRPVAWAIDCPGCEREIEVERIDDDDAGVFHAAAESRFITCESCSAAIEVGGAEFRTVSDDPWYARRS